MVENSDNHVTRVLFCGPYFPASQNYTREYVAHLPYIQVDEASLEDVPDVIGNYDICVVKNRRVDSEVIAKANRMKLMMQYGVGLDGVDVEAATRHGIKVARIPGSVTGNSASCAEMAIYLMLGLLRKQKEMEISVSQKRLGEPAGETLLGKTVFILGFGAIGVDLAKRLRPFGVKIIATKRRWAMDLGSDGIDGLIDEKGGPDNLCEFAAEADIVVTSLTLNAETAGIVDSKFLSSMKKGALLVNIARGPLLDYKSVASHLESGHLGGLGIDVAWQEPFDPEDPILKFPNVLITPHVAGVTEYSYRTMAKEKCPYSAQLVDGQSFRCKIMTTYISGAPSPHPYTSFLLMSPLSSTPLSSTLPRHFSPFHFHVFKFVASSADLCMFSNCEMFFQPNKQSKLVDYSSVKIVQVPLSVPRSLWK